MCAARRVPLIQIRARAKEGGKKKTIVALVEKERAKALRLVDRYYCNTLERLVILAEPSLHLLLTKINQTNFNTKSQESYQAT